MVIQLLFLSFFFSHMNFLLQSIKEKKNHNLPQIENAYDQANAKVYKKWYQLRGMKKNGSIKTLIKFNSQITTHH